MTLSDAHNDKQGGMGLAKLGLEDGQVVQEIGWDEDVDEAVREEVEDVVGSPLEGPDFDGVVDAVLMWFREGGGRDLTDDCVDALTALADKGFVVLLTPRAGHSEHVDAADVEEAAQTAGLRVSSSGKVGSDWIATKLVQGGAGKQR